MDKDRITNILKGYDIKDIYYKNEPIWIQELHDNVATVGFLNSTECKDIHIKDLYEKNNL